MTIADGNIFSLTEGIASHEKITPLLTATNMHLRRIVSHAHASPEGFWYDQEWAEWVIVLKGSAGLLFEGESAPRVLSRRTAKWRITLTLIRPTLAALPLSGAMRPQARRAD